MTAITSIKKQSQIFYPSSDGEPVAETYTHLYALFFDPKGEWIEEKLRGYRLQGESYQLITDSRSEPLKLRLAIEGELIGFYREDTGEKLLIPDELAAKLQEETQAKQEAENRANQAEELLARYRERFGDLNE